MTERLAMGRLLAYVGRANSLTTDGVHMSTTLNVQPDTSLDVILAAGETVAAAFAAELLSIADQADANSRRYTNLDTDHGGIGSASHCARVFATSLRWRANQILDAAEHPARPVVA
jgi:hypothetical protein